jgi:hypothetical protein
MNNDQLQDILEQHRQWLSGDDGQRADLRDANLRGANLRGAYLEGANLIDADLTGADLTGADLIGANLEGANFEGAKLIDANLIDAKLEGADLTGANLNWQSHDLIAEILRRAASDDIEKRKVAGLILVSRDWCWKEFLSLNDPITEWALDELAKWVQDGDNAPEMLKTKSSTPQETKPSTTHADKRRGL